MSKRNLAVLLSTNNLCLQQSLAHTSTRLNSFIPGTIFVWYTLPYDLTHSLSFNKKYYVTGMGNSNLVNETMRVESLKCY